MLCLACSAPGSPLCPDCLRTLKRVSSRVVDAQNVHVDVEAAFGHHGAAARLVHNLKYRRSLKAGEVLASHMAELVPVGVDALVPIPRVLARRVAYGVDQTAVLARLISEITGIPVRNSLQTGWWHRRSAGLERERRSIPSFATRGPVVGRPVLVDDVCTTGSTLIGAALAMGHSLVHAVVASSATGEGAVSGWG